MCGIAGFEARDEAGDTQREAAVADRLHRRGPDGFWTAAHGPYRLVQTRLAIIDLSDRVVYPIANEQEDLWLLFNGEIYNHVALRRELTGRGHRFRTACDAEVVVHAYEEWGASAFAHLNGMFALALIDERRGGELVLVRDRLGIKPLFFARGPRFAFASDALTLVRGGFSSGTPSPAALASYAALHYLPPPTSGLADVASLEPGTFLRRRPDGGSTTHRWAARPFSEPEPVGELALDDVDGSLRGAVERQLRADVEVGVFLSSGTDSALVLSYAAELGVLPKCFTVRFSGQGDYDESDAAGALARAFGAEHFVYDLRLSFAEAVGLLADAFDVPFADSSALPTLALARFARDQITVALTGTGGDDLFAGYYRYRAHRLRRLALVLAPLANVAASGARGAERRSTASLFRSYAARVLQAAASDPVHQYLRIVSDAATPMALETLKFEVRPDDVVEDLADRLQLTRSNAGGIVRRLQAFDLATYLPGDLLTKEDRATMTVGLEGRVPLLDDEVLRIASKMSDSQKASLFSGKRPLRDLARKRLPQPISARKRGFAVPLHAFFAGPWRNDATEWFASQDSSLVDCRRAAELVAHGHGGPDIWALCTLVAWEGELESERHAAIRAST